MKAQDGEAKVDPVAEVAMPVEGIPGYDPKTAPRVDFDARGAEVMAEAKRRDAISCYETAVPKAYRDFHVEHPALKKNGWAVRQVLDWQFGPAGMLIAGATGRGKTRSVWALMRRLAYQDGVLARAYHAQDFFSALAGEVKYGRDDAAAWIDRKAWHPVVFIDDWGQEAVLANREDWAQGWWMRFVDLRLERRLPLIITTNLSEDDVRGNQNSGVRADPLLRRLREICSVVRFL